MNRTKKVSVVIALMLLLSLAINGTLAWLKDETKPVQNTFTLGKVKIKLDETDVNEKGKVIPDAPRVEGNARQNYHFIPGSTYTKDPTVTVLAGSEPCYIRVFAKVDLAGKKPGQLYDAAKTAVLQYAREYIVERKDELISQNPAFGYFDFDNLADEQILLVLKAKLGQELADTDSLVSKYIAAVEDETDTYTLKVDAVKELLQSIIHGAQFSATAEWPWLLEDVYWADRENPTTAIVEFRYHIPGDDDTYVHPGAGEEDVPLPALFTGFTIPGKTPQELFDFVNGVYGEGDRPSITFVAQAIQAENMEDVNEAWNAAGIPYGYEHEPTGIRLESEYEEAGIKIRNPFPSTYEP